MKVAITGSTGFIGKHLTTFLIDKGVEVHAIKREHFLPDQKLKLASLLSGCDAVINLAGASINCRWTKANKQEIRDSRVKITRILVQTINELATKPEVLLSISAVGIYTNKEVWSERSGAYDKGFLASVCLDWEAEAKKVSPDVRLVIPRLGVVLGKDGGAFPKMFLPFRFYAGGRIASGNQGFSWIHIDDLLDIFWTIINTKKIKGIIHCTAPQMCDNLIFTYTLAKVSHRPVFLHIPSFIFRIIYGESASLITKGPKVFPYKLLNYGYLFQYPEIKSALKNLCN
ncbi:TIGR01777 family oxidoreductase [uncultured Bacteroides sp.]|uniref:TIGR01777 family oxidoreductase n=1 Tax=uncultured Bacteroides sp. TaxID=162156 RepID=UPI002AAC2327|nr:TIGR01777 family oxidoreductase [uncultured Bacteroides sp.]